jgi:hypothetical protein
MTTKSFNLNIKEYLDHKRTKRKDEISNDPVDEVTINTPVAISGRPNDAIDFSFPHIKQNTDDTAKMKRSNAMSSTESQTISEGTSDRVQIPVYSARAKKYTFKTMTESTVTKAIAHKTKEQIRMELPMSTFTWSENRKQDQILTTLDVVEKERLRTSSENMMMNFGRSGASSAPLYRRATTPTPGDTMTISCPVLVKSLFT